MSRPIKFRAWCNELKQMFEVTEMVVGPTVTTWVKNKDYSRMIVHGENGVLMQFTGLHDKNGKEIWDGDILQEDALQKLVVYWNQEECRFGLKRVTSKRWIWFVADKNRTVLGNIYENGDLLK